MMNNKLHEICQRIASLESERRNLAGDIADAKAAAKSDGYDAALISKTVRLMLLSDDKRQKALQQHDLFDTYLAAAGLIPDRDGDAP